MKCILCGKKLEEYDSYVDTAVYCNIENCELFNVVMSVDAAQKLESIAQTSTNNQWVSEKYQEWAKAQIAELYEERDEARKLAYKYYKELEQKQEQKDWEDASDFDALAFENKLKAEET